ncbi:terminase large subunit, partial [Haemophilus influenzae]|uniref:terminase large subunit n=1 Tax=Haemophilus influenzae TaxID=727 RepID=UPI001EF770EA
MAPNIKTLGKHFHPLGRNPSGFLDCVFKILEGNEQNDSLFVLIFELDEESEIDNPENWIKANPNIGKSIP